MTPQQIQLNDQVCELPVIKELKENHGLFHQELEELRNGQKIIDNDMRSGFQKGKSRMDGLEEMFQTHIRTTGDNHKEAMRATADLKTEIKDNKIKDMASDISKRSEEFKAYREKVWSLAKIIFTGAFGITLGALAVHFGIK